MILKDIHILILIAVMIFGAAVAVWGTIRFAIPNLKESLGTVNKKLASLEGIIVPKEIFDQEIERIDRDFKLHEQRCQRVVCGRIDDIRADLKGMDIRRENARNARILAWDKFKKEMVPRLDFNEYKEEMKGHVNSIEGKIDGSVQLLARLDERVKTLLKQNGHNSKDGG